MAGEIIWKVGFSGLKEAIAEMKLLNIEIAKANSSMSELSSRGVFSGKTSGIGGLMAQSGLASFIQSQQMNRLIAAQNTGGNASLISSKGLPKKLGAEELKQELISMELSPELKSKLKNVRQKLVGGTAQALDIKGLPKKLGLEELKSKSDILTHEGILVSQTIYDPEMLKRGIKMSKAQADKYRASKLTAQAGEGGIQELGFGLGSFGGRGLHAAAAGAREIGGRGLARLVMEFGKMGVVVGGLLVAFIALKKGIEEASEAYRTAAAQGLSVKTSYGINQAFNSLGMKTPNLNNVYGLGQGNDANVILNAARTGQFGEQGQQLLNMADEFRDAMKDAESSSRQMEKASKSGMVLSMDMSAIWRELKTLFAQLAESATPVIHGLLVGIKDLLKTINSIVEVYNTFLHPLKTLGIGPGQKGGTNNQQYWFGRGGAFTSPTTSIEKLGFVMHGASPEKNLTDINKNTTGMLAYLREIANNLKIGAERGYHAANTVSLIHLPSLP